MGTVITDLVTSTKLEEILLSKVNVALWDYEDGVFSNPRWESVQIDYRLIPHNFGKSDKLIADYINAVLNYLRNSWRTTNNQLNKLSSKHKQRSILENKLNLITNIGSNIHEYIKLDSNDDYTTLKTPPFTQLIQTYLLDGFHHISFSKFAKATLGFPFGILENGIYTKEQANISDLLKAKSIALDFETKNWEPVYLENMKDLPEDVIKNILLNAAEKFNEPIAVDWLDKRAALRKLEEIENKHRGESITIEIDSLTGEGSKQNLLFTTLNYDHSVIHDGAVAEVIFAKDQVEIILQGNKFYQKEQPFFVTGYNILGFDIPKSSALTKNFNRGISGKKARFVNKACFGELHEIPGRSILDAFPYLRSYGSMNRHKMDDAHALLCGGGDKKIISHDQISELTKKAEFGDEESVRILLEYALQDGIKTVQISNGVIEEILLGAMMHNCSTASFVYKSRKNKGKEYWETNTRSRLWSKVYKNNKPLAYDKFDFYKTINDKLKLKTKKGVHKGYLVSLSPLIDVFNSLLKSNTFDLLSVWQNEKEPRRKMRLTKLLEDVLIYPFFRTLGDTGNDQYCNDFSCDFSGKRVYTQHFEETIFRLQKSLEDKIINYSGSLFLLSEPAYFPLNFPSIDVTEGTFVSGSKGTFLSKDIMCGISHFQSNKGNKTVFEKNFYETFFDLVLNSENQDCSEAYVFVHDCVVKLNSGEFDEILYWEKVARMNFYDVSARSNQEHTNIMREQKILKGQKYSQHYTREEAINKFFGDKGTISKILNWVFTKKELKPIYDLINHN